MSVQTSGALALAAIDGDGIGPEVVGACSEVLVEAAARRSVDVRIDRHLVGFAAVSATGQTVPDGLVDRLRNYDGIVLGPVDHAQYPVGDPSYRNPSGVLRKELELYANIRPVRSLPGVTTRFTDVDLVVVRENTEGFYADRNTLDGSSELRIDEDTVVSLRVVTRRACSELAKVAFRLASTRAGMRTVTAGHKANVLKRGDGLFLDACRSVASEYPDVQMKDRHVDALALDLVLDPCQFDVIVTTNMFGDILSDEAAGLVGGLGLAPGLNVGPKHVMAQAVHGSAPDLAGRGVANPMAEILSGQLLFEHLGRVRSDPALSMAGQDISRAVDKVLSDGRVLTPDLGGTATTQELTRAVIAALT